MKIDVTDQTSQAFFPQGPACRGRKPLADRELVVDAPRAPREQPLVQGHAVPEQFEPEPPPAPVNFRRARRRMAGQERAQPLDRCAAQAELVETLGEVREYFGDGDEGKTGDVGLTLVPAFEQRLHLAHRISARLRGDANKGMEVVIAIAALQDFPHGFRRRLTKPDLLSTARIENNALSMTFSPRLSR